MAERAPVTHSPLAGPVQCGMSSAPDVPPSLLEAFARNGEVNAALLGVLHDDDLTLDDDRGGRSIGVQLGHLAESRWYWLSVVAPAHAEGIPSVLDGDESELRLTATSVREIAAALVAGDTAALAAVRDALREGRSFAGAYESDPTMCLLHTIVHDAHHRGQIVNLLRSRGRRSEAELEALDGAIWPIWRR
jgi:uncharacterized damage-inducible protein DinB